MTSTEKNPLGVQAIMSGGNAGSTALAITIDVLKNKRIALIGFDFGYPEGTPAEKTSYYSSIFRTIKETTGKDTLVASATALTTLSHHYHPIFKTNATSDPVFDGYRASLYEMLASLPRECQIYNCTMGGTLFSPFLKCVSLEAFLNGSI